MPTPPTPIPRLPEPPGATTSSTPPRPPGGALGRVVRSLGLVGMCIVVSGLVLNVYLVVVARNLTAAEYSYFGAFWSLALIVGFGGFLPVEQELARRLSSGARSSDTLRAGAVVAGILAAGAALLVVVASPLLLPALGGRSATVVALVALCAVSALQFLVRGTLVGTGRMGMHGGLLVADTTLRLGLALAVAALVSSATSADFAWAMVAAIAVAHLGALLTVLRPAQPAPAPQSPVPTRALAGAVAPLLLGAGCAQLLLNGAPVLVAALATPAEQAAAGQFVAAFTLARIPLFVAVPLQSALLPALTALITSGRAALLIRRLIGFAAVLMAGAAVGAVVAVLVGRQLLELVFGAGYALAGHHLAVLLLGVAAHLGLLVATQALIASGLHRDVALAWLTGIAAACLVVVLVPDLLLRAELAFLVGSVVGGLSAMLWLVCHQRRKGPQRAG